MERKTTPIEALRKIKGLVKIEEEAIKAVAIKDKDTPKVVAKGKGQLAKALIDVASSLGIPIYDDPDLVEILYMLNLGQELPDPLYEIISEILVFIYEVNKEYGIIS